MRRLKRVGLSDDRRVEVGTIFMMHLRVYSLSSNAIP